MSEIIQALETLQTGRWINLTHDVTADIPHFPIFNPLQTKTLTQIDPDGFDAYEYTIGTQYGTHIDAPSHFALGKRSLEEIPFDERVAPLYVLHFEEEVTENVDLAITSEHIKAYEAEYGIIPAGAFVALSTGWSRYFHDHEAFFNEDADGVAHTPGWTVDALKYLAEKDVIGIGHETVNTDAGVLYAEQGFLDAELYWLEQDRYQVELLTNLEAVPTTGGIIVIGVPHIPGASGFTAEVTAIIPAE